MIKSKVSRCSLFLAFVNFLTLCIPVAYSQEGEGNGALHVEEIIVTARKREENIQKTPISMTAITAGMIEDASLHDLKSIESITPNLSFSEARNGSSSSVQAFIRGVGQFDTVLTTDPGVGIYVDGVYLARTIGSNLEFADIEHIAVLRGPQGTLFGKNTIGGAINVVTKIPTGETDYSLQVTGGSYQYIGVNAYGETPIIEDRLSVSLSFLYKNSDGWQDRTGDDGSNDNMWGLRGHLYWTPTDDISSHLVIDGVGIDQNTSQRAVAVFDSAQTFPFFYNTFVAGGACCTENADIDQSDIANTLERDEVSSFGLSWINTFDLHNGMTLKLITGYRNLDTDAYRDSDNNQLDYFSVLGQQKQKQFSQELVLTGSSFESNLDWIVGGYYFKEDGDHFTEVTVAGGLFEALSALPLTVTTPDGVPLVFLAQPLDLTLSFDRQQKVASYAAYAHVNYHLARQLGLILAGRYTREKKDLSLFSFRRASQSPILPVGPTDPDSCTDTTASKVGTIFSCADSWKEFSPMVGLDYQWNDDLLTYIKVSRGFKSGGFNGRPTATKDISVVNPETLTSYEAGFKSEWFVNRLRFNGAVFYNAYKDQQFLINRPSAVGAGALALVVDNAAKSTLRGFELEFSALPMKGMTIMGGLSYVDAEFDEFTTLSPDPADPSGATFISEDASGRPFADTPKWNASLGIQHEFEFIANGALRLRSDISYKSGVHYTNDEAASSFDLLSPGGFSTINAGITYVSKDNRWELALYGKNLGDKRVINGGFVVDPFGITDVTHNAPRRVFLSLKFSPGT